MSIRRIHRLILALKRSFLSLARVRTRHSTWVFLPRLSQGYVSGGRVSLCSPMRTISSSLSFISLYSQSTPLPLKGWLSRNRRHSFTEGQASPKTASSPACGSMVTSVGAVSLNDSLRCDPRGQVLSVPFRTGAGLGSRGASNLSSRLDSLLNSWACFFVTGTEFIINLLSHLSHTALKVRCHSS